MSSAGRRNRRVEVKVATAVDDGQGGQTVTWATSEELWAEFVPFGARELWQAGSLQVQVPIVARLPYRTTLDVKARIYDPETLTTYEIVTLRDVDGRRWAMEVELVEVT